MKVVDVDAHFFEPFTWMRRTAPGLQEELLATLPPVGFVDGLFGEVLANLPPEQRSEFASILPFEFLGDEDRQLTPEEAEAVLADSPFGETVLGAKGGANAADRVAACDEQGIDVQLVNPTFVLFEMQRVYRHRRDRMADLCEAYNSWALEVVDGHVDRFLPIATVDIGDPGRAVAELTRVRQAGSRAFLLPLYPVDGRPLSHPDFEPIWSAATDLGMLPVMHVASGSVVFDQDWVNTGRPNAAVSAFRLAAALVPQVPQAPLADMLFNGVFERHPELTLLCSEFGLSWLQAWWERIGPWTHKVHMQGLIPWEYPLTPHEYIRRNVRFSPLPGDPVDRFIDDFGVDMLWFSSDYPHPEGSATAIAEYEAQLDGKVDKATSERFFGGGAADFLARTA